MLNLKHETQDNSPSPGAGHNSGATKTDWAELLDRDAIRIALTIEHDALLAKKIELTKAFDEFVAAHTEEGKVGMVLTTEQDVADATDKGAQLKAMAKKVETTRVTVKQPFFDADKAVQVFFRNIGEPLEKAAQSLEAAISAFTRAKAEQAKREAAEAARIQREEADRVAAAATQTMNPDLLDQAVIVEEAATKAERQAAKPIADFSRARGDFAVSSARVTYSYEVEDITLVPHEYLLVNESKVRTAINGKDRLKAIPGLKIVENYKTSIRS